MFENKIYENIHYSRFIASWYIAGGSNKRGDFVEWLESLIINGKPIPKETIDEIEFLFSNGKLELETRAKLFIQSKKLES
jgi:hypothetical protein